MGYEVMITRKIDIFDAAGPAVTVEDLIGLIADDGSLAVREDVTREVEIGGGRVELTEPLVLWTGHPDRGEVPLYVSRGDVRVKNPDQLVIVKLMEIAASLGARVQDENGEVFALPEDAAKPFTRRSQRVQTSAEPEPQRRRRFFRRR